MWSLFAFMRRTGPAVLLATLVGCTTQPLPPGDASAAKPASAPAAKSSSSTRKAAPPAPPKKSKYSTTHEQEVRSILELAQKGRWVEAEAQAAALYEMDPQDPSVQRLHSWVTKQRELQQNRALENEIRAIDAENSPINATIPELLLEKKDRGLPPRKDVRDAVEQIEATPYVPESYGKTVHRRGMLFDLESEQGRMAKVLDKEISVHLDNVTVEAIIFNVGQAEGINFIADKSLPAFNQKLSVNLDKVKLRELLGYLSRNLDVQFQVGNDLIWIVDAKDPKKIQEETRFYRLRKGFVLPAMLGGDEAEVTTQYNPQNRSQITAITEKKKINRFVNDGTPDMPMIEQAITNLFTGKYLIDYERNLIVARSTREQLEVLEKIIQEFDKPIQQVLIEARFVTVSQPAFLQLGVLWETGRQTAAGRTPTDFTGLINQQNLALVGLGIQETFTNILNSATLSSTISALEQSGESQTLSAPRLTAINNRPATISDGKVSYYYEEYGIRTTITERTASSSFVPQGKPTKINSGVELDVLASIGGDGQTILLALNPKVMSDVRLTTYATLTEVDSTTGNVVSTFDIRLPEYTTQDLATRVVIKSGETVVMGGVIERNQSTYVEAVPILGSLPLIGPLFRRRTETDRPRYLLIFVTATILSESGEFIIYDDAEK